MRLEEVPGGTTLWRYHRPFRVEGMDFRVILRSRTGGLFSELTLGQVCLAEDHTPLLGPEAIRNHKLRAQLPSGRFLEVEAGWISSWNAGIAVRLDGDLVHESHPGRRIAYPEKYRARIIDMEAGGQAALLPQGYDPGAWKRNRVPIVVDVVLGLLFFVVAKLTDLSTAALVGAGAGIMLLVVQRFVKVDLLGGLALFGIVMLLLSAGLALTYQDDMMVKMRSTVLGIITAALFIGDGLLGGNRLGKALARYLPYNDIDPSRLAIGMGVLGLIMAGLNYAVARIASTDVWLFYSTFVDFFLVMLMVLVMFRYARGRIFPRGYRAPQASTTD